MPPSSPNPTNPPQPKPNQTKPNQNYVMLFDFVIDAKDLDMFMNEQWASDIITEFVYQFQDNCQ